ncbi:MAG: hypothetical protein KC776_09825 [Myxococcales bacterium]|nr:hypothetical protein [Myxococcales bacterium]MCB9582181.1 hypothetical protein [Polyangiaceae bacterium]
MRSNSFKVLMSMGFIALVAWSIPACGSDDDSGSGGKAGSSGSGGSGGGTAGSGGTAGGAAGSGGSAGGLTCGGTECTAGWKVGGLIDVAGCCATGDKCGAQIDATIENLLKVPQGCYETEQAGTVDCGCESFVFTNPLDQSQAQFNGCCRPDGKCGFAVDTSSQGGPNLGCVEATELGATGGTCTSGQETPPPTGSDYCAVGDGGTPEGGTDGGVGDASTD